MTSKSSISSLISCNCAQTHNCTDLLRIIGGTVVTFAIITCEFSTLLFQIDKVKLHMEKCYIYYEIEFTKDVLFGIKFSYGVDF